MGATEIARMIALAVGRAYAWIRDGDLRDARAHAWAEIATAGDDVVERDVTLHRFYFQEVIWTVGFK